MSGNKINFLYVAWMDDQISQMRRARRMLSVSLLIRVIWSLDQQDMVIGRLKKVNRRVVLQRRYSNRQPLFLRAFSLRTKPNPLDLLRRRLSHASEKNKEDRRMEKSGEGESQGLILVHGSYAFFLIKLVGHLLVSPSIPCLSSLFLMAMSCVEQIKLTEVSWWGNRRKDEGKMRGQSLMILVVLAVWVRSHFYPLF